MGYILKAARQQLRARVAGDIAQLLVDAQPPAGGGSLCHADRGLIKGGAETFFAVDQLAAGALAFNRQCRQVFGILQRE